MYTPLVDAYCHMFTEKVGDLLSGVWVLSGGARCHIHRRGSGHLYHGLLSNELLVEH